MSVNIARGYRAFLAYAQESSYGTAVTSASYLWAGWVSNAEPEVNMNLVSIWALGQRQYYRQVPGQREIDLKITNYVDDVSYISTAISSGYGASYTLWLNYPDISQAFTLYGGRVKDMTITGKLGEPLEVETSWQLQNVSAIAPANSTLPSDPGTQIFYFGQQSVAYNGTTIPKVWEFSVKIDNDLERVFQLGQTWLRALPEKLQKITGSLKMTFEDLNQFNDMINASPFTLDITIGPSHTITLSSCYWQSYNLPTKPTDLIVHTLPFVAQSVVIS